MSVDKSLPMQHKLSLRSAIKPVTFVLCSLPLLLAIYAVSQNNLGANPIEGLLVLTGEWGLRFLLITLAVTPLQFIFRWSWVARLRRMLGLFAFFYAVMHMLIWVVLDQGLDWSSVINEIIEKKYIAVGFIALLGLLPLALTSNRWSIRKLGKKWKPLHRLVYPLTLLVIVHFLWQVKANDIVEPAIYLAVLLLLLVWRFRKMLS
jgi:sulfoxide reductase heme-binding subunit YedZ